MKLWNDSFIRQYFLQWNCLFELSDIFESMPIYEGEEIVNSGLVETRKHLIRFIRV